MTDGSSTRAEAVVDPDSVDTTKENGLEEKKTPCPFAGKKIILKRLPDETLSNDFQGNASSDDVSVLNSFITPDAIFYPDKPVAVGDVWDNSAKMAKDAMLGPKDQIKSVCRLDWVKVIDGKKMAQISNSQAIIYYEDGNVEEDVESSTTSLVDLAAQMIVRCDQKGSSKYKTPATEPTQVVGGTEFLFHAEMLANAATDTTTKP